jgi:outer membrane protein assembly factor BamB
LVAGLELAALLGLRGAEARAVTAQTIRDKLQTDAGLCVFQGASKPETAVDFAKGSRFMVYVHCASAAEAQAAREAADAAGLLGRRIFVDHGSRERIPLADNLADAVIVSDPAPGPALARKGGVSEQELLRVLRPGGKAFVADRELTKPARAGTDDWSHPYHGADNNPQSADQLARAPYLTHFLADPLFGCQPEVTVTAGGRIFKAFGHMSFRAHQNPVLNTLMAFSAHNGALLWQRDLQQGFMIHRNTMVATPEALYLADDKSCKVLDAATGQLKDEIVVPKDLADGPVWKWMAVEAGVLYALVGGPEVEAPLTPGQAPGIWHWPWAMWPGYDYKNPTNAWGFGRTFLAVDLKTKRLLWNARQADFVDSRGTCLSGGRLFFFVPGQSLACLDVRNGDLVWRTQDTSLLEAIGPPDRAQNPTWGFATSAYLKAHEQYLFFAGPQRKRLAVAAAGDGRLLWSKSSGNFQLVLREDAAYALGNPNSFKLDYATGRELERFGARRSCTRATGSADSVFCRSAYLDGTMRWEVGSSVPWHLAPMRPGCHDGVVVSDGYLHWGPWICGGCNLSLFGIICVTAAGDFNFAARADGRLEVFGGGGDQVKQLDTTPNDWPCFRADSERSATTSAELPAGVSRQWEFSLPEGSQPTAPTAAGGLVFFGDSCGRLWAVDAQEGKLRWKAYTGGSIYFPPEIWRGRAYVGSCDGCVYAFEAATGRLLWRFRVPPLERKIPVYGEVASTWPVAGGVAVRAGTVYAAAGIAHYDGTYVCALDAASGQLKWFNHTSGRLDAKTGDGVSLCGNLSLSGGQLRFNGGTAYRNAAYALETGRCEATAGNGRAVFVPRKAWNLVPAEDQHQIAAGTIRADFDPSGRITLGLYPPPPAEPRPRPARPLAPRPVAPLWSVPCAAYEGSIRAGEVLLALTAVPLDQTRRGPFQLMALRTADGSKLWSHELPGAPARHGLAIDSHRRILVTLEQGQVICLAGR